MVALQATMSPQEDPVPVQIAVKWRDEGQPPTIYANHLMVSHATGPEFYLVFGELSPPALLPASAEELRKAHPDGLKINVVAKIAVTPDALVRFAKVISENLMTFKKSVEAASEKAHAGND